MDTCPGPCYKKSVPHIQIVAPLLLFLAYITRRMTSQYTNPKGDSISSAEIKALYETFMELAGDARKFLIEIVEQSRRYHDEFNVMYEPMEEEEKFPLMEAVGEIIEIQRLYENWESDMIDGEELVGVMRRRKAELETLLYWMSPRKTAGP